MARPRKKRTDLDFRDFKYRALITMQASERVLDFFPQFKKYPEVDPKNFRGKISISADKVLRYVMLYYSPNALRDAFTDMARRKKEAALIAGIEMNQHGKFSKSVEAMFKCEIPQVNNLIVRFLRNSENKKFMQLCVFEEARAKQMQKLMDGIGEKDKELTKVVVSNIKSLTQDIEDLERELLNEDEAIDLIERLYDEIDYTNLGLSPEEIAQAIKDESIKLVLKDPYVHKNDSRKRADHKIIEDGSDRSN